MAPQPVATNGVSTAFGPLARLAAANGQFPDIALVSSDSVRFHVHTSVLRSASSNDFGGLFHAQANSHNIHIDEAAPALNIMLHSAYGLDIVPYTPNWSMLEEGTEAMRRYAIRPPTPTDPLFTLLLSQVHRPGGAQAVYALAAQCEFDALAVAASEHLLSLDLSSITDEWATQCGPVYIKRLFFLHLGRTEALKRIVSASPTLHVPWPGCSRDEQQQNILRPWSFAVAQLIAEARPDVPNSLIETRLSPVAYRSTCVECSELVAAHIRAITQEWSNVKHTI
ncbi:hypothetical protein EXIGLDRAFT_642388 [Exidia glandulosa HHB12029]|uniref:BTB domain-containing protein n=1 Tax=Exidia glandulosa HHB12029 TaxID=1314781 RepID=A0A165L3M6_EXIGL|nr:hypothetical protein EXIGLDRAFT_642388 [Exidia glandulosa HHB12029]